MSMEADVYTALLAQCPRVFPDFADFATPRPYVIYQGIGGTAWRCVDNTPVDKRHTLMQISVWATTRLEANTLARSIEDALCVATAFTARPDAEPTSIAEEDLNLYGTQQDFVIVSPR